MTCTPLFCNTSMPVKFGHAHCVVGFSKQSLMGNLSKARAMTVSEFCLMLLRTWPSLRSKLLTLAVPSWYGDAIG